MVLRIVKRGENAGNQFWGCSTFPKCRAIVAAEEPATAATQADAEGQQICRFSNPPPEPQKGLLQKIAAAVDGIRRWSLEADEPDATNRWKPEHRKQALDYLHTSHGMLSPVEFEVRHQHQPAA